MITEEKLEKIVGNLVSYHEVAKQRKLDSQEAGDYVRGVAAGVEMALRSLVNYCVSLAKEDRL